MNVTLNVSGIYPDGTLVAVHPSLAAKRNAPPAGSPVTTATVAAGVLILAALEELTQYVCYAAVSGAHRYVHFQTVAAVVAGESADGYPDGWFNVKSAEFGAVGDGVTDDAAAVQAAITAASLAGGTVYFPPGTYNIGTTLDCRNVGIGGRAFRMMGAAGVHENISKTRLHWTGGPGSGSLLDINNTVGLEISHLFFGYTDITYDGDLINIRNSASDPQWIHIHHCGTRGTVNTSQKSARSIIRIFKAVNVRIENCALAGAQNCVRVGETGYANVIAIEKCVFHHASDAFILIDSGDCETLVVRHCTFEAGTNTTAIKGSSICRLYAPLIEGNWFGDNSTATVWIDGLRTISDQDFGVISANRMDDVGVGGTFCKLAGKWLVMGNEFLGSGGSFVFDVPAAGGTMGEMVLIANRIANATLWGASALPPKLTRINTGDTGDVRLPPQIRLGQGSGNALGIGDTSDPNVLFVLGTKGSADAAGFVAAPAGVPAIYRGSSTPMSTFREWLAVQAPQDGSGGGGFLVAGTVPAQVLAWEDAKLGFFGTAAQAKPAVTGSRGGNAALASLLTALATLGLITDSSTA
jgi:hypothetical protein